MRKIDIEHWALRTIEAVLAGRPSEDEHVELKADWMPDDQDFARRLAGHANAARGEPILWLFGVDEKGRSVPGVQARDAASWWPSVARWFDGVAPDPTQISVPYEQAIVAAILVETDRAPFVVRNPQFGTAGVKIAYEVPWRARTSIGSATREDLIRLLVPTIRVPMVEVLQMTATAPGGRGQDMKEVNLQGKLYLSHTAEQRIHIPDHLTTGEIASAAGGQMPIIGASLSPTMMQRGAVNPNFIRTDSDLTALGPGQLSLSATGKLAKASQAPVDVRANFDDFSMTASLEVELRFAILGSDIPIVVRARLAPAQRSGETAGAWALKAV